MSDGRVARVRRVLPATPEVVYDEWLDPVSMADWMCPRPARADAIDIDPRVGGMIRLSILDSGSKLYVTGQFTELDRPRLLRFTWSCSDWADPSAQSVVTVSLAAHGTGQTLMTIAHEQLPPDQVDDHYQGWTAIAEQLADFTAGASQ